MASCYVFAPPATTLHNPVRFVVAAAVAKPSAWRHRATRRCACPQTRGRRPPRAGRSAWRHPSARSGRRRTGSPPRPTWCWTRLREGATDRQDLLGRVGLALLKVMNSTCRQDPATSNPTRLASPGITPPSKKESKQTVGKDDVGSAKVIATKVGVGPIGVGHLERGGKDRHENGIRKPPDMPGVKFVDEPASTATPGRGAYQARDAVKFGTPVLDGLVRQIKGREHRVGRRDEEPKGGALGVGLEWGGGRDRE